MCVCGRIVVQVVDETVVFIMKLLVCVFTFLHFYKHVTAEIRHSIIFNKLANVKAVGGAHGFIPLTEIPPPRKPLEPHVHLKSGRRHLQDECTQKPGIVEVHGGPSVDIVAEYYDEYKSKTVATVRIPEHIDHYHFDVTTPVPYLTVGTVPPIGYHPSTIKSDHPAECEKIYQDHMAEQYSDESPDYSEESLEMARVPLFPRDLLKQDVMDHMYSDFEFK